MPPIYIGNRQVLKRYIGSREVQAVMCNGQSLLAPPALLMASTMNPIANSSDSISKPVKLDRWPHYIAHDCAAITPAWNNWYGDSNTSAVVLLPAKPTFEAVVEYNGASVTCTFGGAATTSVAAGQNRLMADELEASRFGASKFAAGTVVWVKTRTTFVTLGDGVAYSAHRSAAAIPGAQSWFYDPAVTTINNFYSTGAPTSSGATPTTRVNGWCSLLLGRPSSGTPLVWCARGDSITQGTGDATPTQHGAGWFQRAIATLRAGAPCASLNLAVHGSRSTLGLSHAYFADWYKYANRGVVFYGTNDVGSGSTLAAIQASVRQIRSDMIAAGIAHVLGSKLLVRASSTDLWATEANQTVFSGWGAGEIAAQFSASVGSLGFDAILPMDSIRGINQYKWLTNGASRYTAYDDTHPSDNGATLMANESVPIMRSVG